MMQAQTITLTTNGSGAASGRFAAVNGKVLALIWTKPGSGGITGATFSLVTDKTKVTVWSQAGVSASQTIYPRSPLHTTAGVAITFDGTNAAYGDIPVCDETLTITVSGGGSTLTGTLTLIVG